MHRLIIFMCLLFFNSESVLAKQTTTTINISVKFREFTCNIVSSRGSSLSFGDVSSTTLTTTSGPEIESDLTLTCRLDASAPELTGSNATSAIQSANLRFTSPASATGAGGDFLDVGNNVAILPFFNNARMRFNNDYNLKTLGASGYKLKFQLVKKSSAGEISAGQVSVVLNAELTYT